MRYSSKFLIIAGAAFMAASPVFAQNVNSPEARLDRMEREMQTLSRSVYKGDVPPPQFNNANSSNTAATELRLSGVEEQMQRLTGQIEEQGYQIRQMESKLNDFMTQTSTRLNSEPSGSARASQTITNDIDGDNNASASVTTSAPSVQQYQLGTLNADDGATPASLYDKAFSYLQTNDYASAQAAFEQFMKQYPDHSLAANAQYWLGETFYAREDYEAAARVFAKSYQDFPQGQKAPDTLLKLGMSLGNRGMKDEACLTLSELKKRFPSGPPSVMTKADEQSKTYGCDA